MVSSIHQLLLEEGRNNRSNSDFLIFFKGFIFFSRFEINCIIRNKLPSRAISIATRAIMNEFFSCRVVRVMMFLQSNHCKMVH